MSHPPSNRESDFITSYIKYSSNTECPTLFHRWCAISALAAWIGRDIHFPFGHSNIHANMYLMLVGLSGTRKTTAVKLSSKLIKLAGYKNFAAKKTRQEKYLIDLASISGIVEGEAPSMSGKEDSILDMNLFGDGEVDIDAMPSAESYVSADEINNFIGVNNLDFMSILGDLWDIEEPYDYRLKNSKSVIIATPTINILGGNTFTGFSKLFPPEAIDQGFFSRMLFIYAEPKGREFTIPPKPCPIIEQQLIKQLHRIKEEVKGEVSISDAAYSLLDNIYMKWEGMDDPRFDSYENRRIVHLLKLAMVLMATKLRTTIEREDIIAANTLLTFTEHLMPKALGEFGKARNSDVTHKIMSAIDAAKLPLAFQDIWKLVHIDLEGRNQLADILGNLVLAEKIQNVQSNAYLPVKKVRGEGGVEGAIDWSLLTNQERDLV